MARMYPRTLEGEQVKSRAEKRLFGLLRDQLPDEWEAYHSVSWMIRDPGTGAEDGEIDFVLCHPEKGIVCLEVKGGGLECNHGEWHRRMDGKRERMADPFKQAIDHRYDLSRKIDQLDGWRGKDLFLTHALCFPDISVHKLVLSPDAPPEIVIDMNGVKDLETSIESVLAYHQGAREKRRNPGDDGAEMLRDLLAREIRIDVPMAAEFLEEEERMITLTLNQAAALNSLARTKRLAVAGCAGSGKTMIAVEHAKRLAAAGKDVLFVCFNRGLRDHLRQREANTGVTFNTFHGLCFALAKKAKIEFSHEPGPDAPQEFWNEEMPLALISASEELGPAYDALLIDEAQDLRNDWLEALMTTLRDPEDNPVWLFLDANQRVYEHDFEVPDEYAHFDLSENCRNTQAIHREVVKKYEGEVTPTVVGPPGRDVDLILTDDQPGTVAAIISRLCEKEEVPPQDVVVLSAHGHESGKSEVLEANLGRFSFVKEPKPVGPYIRFSSIRGFKPGSTEHPRLIRPARSTK
ncbi:MAG: NERD domain-containing protein [Solirubrobacterales bacterium]